jgi:N-acyl homoserine lactone hydrolase
MKNQPSQITGICKKVVAAMGALLLVACLSACQGMMPSTSAATAPVRLYILDCGTLHLADTKPFGLASQEVQSANLSIACALVTHAKGSLVWDTGAVPDAEWTATGSAVTHTVTLPGAGQRQLTLRKPLAAQLAQAGFAPRDITYLALSHFHFDHTANANQFSEATWLTRAVERDAMFAEKAPFATRPVTYAALRNSKTVVIQSDEHDVFGDGTVILKSAPGHTAGHQILYLKLAKTGPVVLSGDLYHFPQSRSLDRVPAFDFNQLWSRNSRAAVEGFLKEKNAQLWIQHDYESDARLKKAPGFYD